MLEDNSNNKQKKKTTDKLQTHKGRKNGGRTAGGNGEVVDKGQTADSRYSSAVDLKDEKTGKKSYFFV